MNEFNNNIDDIIYAVAGKAPLLSNIGVVPDARLALSYMRSQLEYNEKIYIDEVNEAAETAGVYLNEKGGLLSTFKESDKSQARYLIVPTGYNHCTSGLPLMASFFKNGGGTWEGVFINTIAVLIKRHQEYYLGAARGNKITDKMRRESNRLNGIIKMVGFGPEEIIANNAKLKVTLQADNTVYADEEPAPHIAHLDTSAPSISARQLASKLKADAVREQVALAKGGKTASSTSNALVIQDDVGETSEPDSAKLYTIADDIYNMLMNKDDWAWNHRNKVRGHLDVLLERVKYLIKSSESRVGSGYIVSKDWYKCIINTGLIDVFNNDIYIVDMQLDKENIRDKELVISSDKSWMVSLGFEKELLRKMPSPVTFHNEISELIFSGDIDEFDLSNKKRLDHIITERRDRFPEKCQDMSKEALGNLLVKSIQRAVRMSKRDYKFILPMYNIKYSKIQYLIPFYLDESSNAMPELAIIAGERNGFYCAFTIISLEDAYENARTISSPNGSWLSNNWMIQTETK